MVKRKFLNLFRLVLFLWILTGFTSISNPDEIYYYYKGEKIYLQYDPTILSVSMLGERALEDLRNILKNDETLQHIGENNVWATIENSGNREFGKDRSYYAEIKFSKPLNKEGVIEIKKDWKLLPLYRWLLWACIWLTDLQWGFLIISMSS